jgi:hypothetical protein
MANTKDASAHRTLAKNTCGSSDYNFVSGDSKWRSHFNNFTVSHHVDNVTCL